MNLTECKVPCKECIINATNCLKCLYDNRDINSNCKLCLPNHYDDG